ncbi:MAG: TraR/DksA family transcriptional regulator [Porticoccus sp.]|nr:TraR/DksA family transcriptional regulator [Porticoccus sp.]|tara:strand:- start:157 stop:471 length:315 start_codon:yes stop_codon:yes gene_type:complete
MNNRQHDTLKLQIETRIEALETLLTLADSGKNTDANASNADAMMISAVNAQITVNEKKELVRLKQNLPWLESSEAGYCQKCGNDIPFARLQAVPITRLCINCAQ